MDLADLDDPALMRSFAEFTAWADYLNGQLALAEIDERETEAVLSKAKAVALLTADPGKGEVRKAEAERLNDPYVMAADEAYRVAYRYRKMLRVLYENAERDQAAISRELTRRTGREPSERRNRRWNP